MGGVAGARLAAGAAAGAIGGMATGGARAAGAASGAYAAGSAGKSGATSVAGGLGGVGKAAGNAAMSPLRRAAASMKQGYESGRAATSGTAAATAPEAFAASGPPAWAKSMKQRQTMSHGASVAAHTLRGGDSHGGGTSVDTSEKE